jgi:minor extracellular serine protease Vpr
MRKLILILWILNQATLNAQIITIDNASAKIEVLSKINYENCLLKDKAGFMHALVLVDKNKAQNSHFLNAGCKIQTKAGNVWSVLIPENRMDDFLTIPGLIAFEPATRVSSARLQMDSARNVTQAFKVQNGTDWGLPNDFNGKNVVVGIVDIGFQFNHPAFFASDSNTLRISRVWQQNYEGNSPPQGFDYGVEYKDPQRILSEREYHGTHGTHVAGIAAGSGIGSPQLKYKGMAPEAELVFVSIKYYNDDLPGSALSDYLIANPAIIDAYKYIFDYAKSVGKPAVINLSWGMHTGPHDGTSLFDLATNNLVGEGNILVGAAGNYGQNPMHFDYLLLGDTAKTIIVENQRLNYKKEEVYVDIWGSGNSFFSLSVNLIDTFGNIVYQTPFISSQQSGTAIYTHLTDSGVFTVSAIRTPLYLPNQKPNITLWVTNPNPRLYYASLALTSPYSQIHAWNSGGIYRYASGRFADKFDKLDFSGHYVNGNTDYTVGENGGTSKSVITVGATTAKNFYVGIFNDTFDNKSYSAIGSVTPFSSRGPTADGRIKPDISAPGLDVAAPIFLQEYPGWAWNRLLAKEAFKGDTFAYGAFSGTSMASPQVAGIVALMLQANPRLNNLQIRNILAKTAIVDMHTGLVPNNNVGWGKANAFEAVKESIRIVGIGKVNKGLSKILVYPNPTQNKLQIESENEAINRVDLYDISGRRLNLIITTLNLLQTTIDLSSFESGIYLLQVNQQTFRIIKD